MGYKVHRRELHPLPYKKGQLNAIVEHFKNTYVAVACRGKNKEEIEKALEFEFKKLGYPDTTLYGKNDQVIAVWYNPLTAN